MLGLLDTGSLGPAMLVLLISIAGMFAVSLSFLLVAWRLRRANDAKAADWARIEASWRTTIACVMHGLLGESSVHDRIEPGERLRFLDFLYKSIRDDADSPSAALYRRLAMPYVSDLEARALTGDVWQRARAIRTLADLVGADTGGVIVDALDDPAPLVARTAARAYARLGLGPVEGLLDRMDRYREWDRRLLRVTLSSFGASAAEALHARYAHRGLLAGTRAVFADALADLDFAPANETALQVLATETDVDLVAATLRLIRPPASERHRSAVRPLCASADPVVRSQAIACLARIGTEADMVDVQDALADMSPWVVLSAARGLTRRRGAAESASPASAFDEADPATGVATLASRDATAAAAAATAVAATLASHDATAPGAAAFGSDGAAERAVATLASRDAAPTAAVAATTASHAATAAVAATTAGARDAAPVRRLATARG